MPAAEYAPTGSARIDRELLVACGAYAVLDLDLRLLHSLRRAASSRPPMEGRFLDMSKQEEAGLILKLYELRREETMRKARDWYFREFNPQSMTDFNNAIFGGQSGHLRTHRTSGQSTSDTKPESCQAWPRMPLLRRLYTPVASQFQPRSISPDLTSAIGLAGVHAECDFQRPSIHFGEAVPG